MRSCISSDDNPEVAASPVESIVAVLYAETSPIYLYVLQPEWLKSERQTSKANQWRMGPALPLTLRELDQPMRSNILTFS